jgi:hypothetical protein
MEEMSLFKPVFVKNPSVPIGYVKLKPLKFGSLKKFTVPCLAIGSNDAKLVALI